MRMMCLAVVGFGMMGCAAGTSTGGGGGGDDSQPPVSAAKTGSDSPGKASNGSPAPSEEVAPATASRESVVACELARGSLVHYCERAFGHMNFRVVPTVPGGARGLALYLHPEGQKQFDEPSNWSNIEEWAFQNGIALLVPNALNGCEWSSNHPSGVCPPSEVVDEGIQARKLAAIMDAFGHYYGGSSERNVPWFIAGASGGASFLSGTFVPMYGAIFGGNYVLSCGGTEPTVGFNDIVPWQTGGSKPWSIYFDYSTAASNVSSIVNAAQFYAEDKERVVQSWSTSNAGYCYRNSEWQSTTIQTWQNALLSQK